MSVRRLDFPLNIADNVFAALAGAPQTVDSGVELVDLTLTSGTTYPLGTSPARTGANAGLQRDMPPRWYDVRRCRGLTIQLTTWNVVGAQPVVRFNVSQDAVGVVPLNVFDPATGLFLVNRTIASGGGASAPTPAQFWGQGDTTANSLMLVIDAPWFSWLQLQIVTPAGTSGTGLLSIARRD